MTPLAWLLGGHPPPSSLQYCCIALLPQLEAELLRVTAASEDLLARYKQLQEAVAAAEAATAEQEKTHEAAQQVWLG